MKKKIVIAVVLLSAALLGGCGEKRGALASETTVGIEESTVMSSSEALAEENFEISKVSEENEAYPEQADAELPDGTYTAEFQTDSSMFRVNEACDGKGTLTVENGKMMIHISLGSKKIVNLYPGLAEDAAKDGAKLLLPTEDTVTYSDGTTEDVYGFDVPVPALETEFDVALIGTKEKWYNHKVRVSNPVTLDGKVSSEPIERSEDLEDGTYTVELTFAGGSGKAAILSPVAITAADGKITATVQWSSPNYDYMLVDGEKYYPVNTEGNSVFEIPIRAFDKPIEVIGDTVAMSKPHEVEYTLTFHSDTIKK